MDATPPEAPSPTDEQIDEATQALLSRNATIIHTLVQLSRRRGAAPMPREAALAAEAYDNLAAVALTFPPAELAAPPVAPPAAAAAPAVQPAAPLQKPAFSAAAAARSLGLLPQTPPPVATRVTTSAAALQQGPASGALPHAATATAVGKQRPQAATAAAAARLLSTPQQLAAPVHPHPLQRLPSYSAAPSAQQLGVSYAGLPAKAAEAPAAGLAARLHQGQPAMPSTGSSGMQPLVGGMTSAWQQQQQRQMLQPSRLQPESDMHQQQLLRQQAMLLQQRQLGQRQQLMRQQEAEVFQRQQQQQQQQLRQQAAEMQQRQQLQMQMQMRMQQQQQQAQQLAAQHLMPTQQYTKQSHVPHSSQVSGADAASWLTGVNGMPGRELQRGGAAAAAMPMQPQPHHAQSAAALQQNGTAGLANGAPDSYRL